MVRGLAGSGGPGWREEGRAIDNPGKQTGPPAAEAWVFLPLSLVPERWRRRVTPLAAVPLLPSEAEAVLSGEPVEPEVGPEDERLLALVASGMGATAVSRELGVSVRTVEYRLQRLRRRLGVKSTAELVAVLAEGGFGRLRKQEGGLRRKDGQRRRTTAKKSKG